MMHVQNLSAVELTQLSERARLSIGALAHP